jgi:sugar lactone lactonase YvrE
MHWHQPLAGRAATPAGKAVGIVIAPVLFALFIDMSSAEPGVPDRMKMTRDGHLFCTGSGGIWVIDPQGQRVGVIRVPEVPRNLAFGGPDARTLYITAGKSLYSLPTRVVGIAAF